MLSSRGYEPFELTSVMFRPTAGRRRGAGVADRVADVRVIAAGEAAAWAEVAADGWSDTPEVVPFVRDIGGVYAQMRNAQCFLVEHDGVAAAAGVLAVHDGVAVLAGASTRPGQRRKGAQLALLGARLAEARRLRLRPGDDVGPPRQHVAAQRRAPRLPDRLHADQVEIER